MGNRMMTVFRIFFLLLFSPLCSKNIETAFETASKCEVFFSPDDHVASRLISLIDAEKESLAVAAYAFSHSKIATALCSAHARGVKVEVIVDPYSLTFSSVLKKMTKAGIPVWIWKGEKTAALMHDKFCLFGDRAIWTGSFNFTNRADAANQENAILIHDKEIAKKFKLQFQKIRDSGCKKFVLESSNKDG
jgi:phosphatidylserine/phosphatidylglycerophosphate/cardiolipin synthase-like enzyme